MTGASTSPEDAARDRANVAAFTRPARAPDRARRGDARQGRRRELPRAVHGQRRAHRLRRAGAARMYPGFAPAVVARCATRRSTSSAPPMPSSEPRRPIDLLGGDRADPRRASAADPAVLRERGDGAGDGPAERQPAGAAVAVQRRPGVRAPDRARRDPAADALRPAAAAGDDRRRGAAALARRSPPTRGGAAARRA